MRALDTNILARYLSQDDRVQATLATRVIESELTEAEPGFIALVTLCELTWVLESAYGRSQAQVADVLERILATRQLRVERPTVARGALDFYRSTAAGFADAVMALVGREEGCTAFVTFDKGCAKLPGARVLGR